MAVVSKFFGIMVKQVSIRSERGVDAGAKWNGEVWIVAAKVSNSNETK